MDTTHTTPEVDEFTLPDHIDPARWPFRENVIRDLVARSSFPEPTEIGRAVDHEARRRAILAYRAGRAVDCAETLRLQAEARRRRVRLGDDADPAPAAAAAPVSGRRTARHNWSRAPKIATRAGS